MTNYFLFEADVAAKRIHIVREFNAPVEKVWRAWTEPALVDKWIAPKPWTAETKIAELKVGGIWLYVMMSPEGHKHWVYDEFTAIEYGSAFSQMGMGCDEEGNPLRDAPKSYKDTKFMAIAENRTKVDSILTFEDEATIKWFVEGGFKEGTMMTLEQLDELLAAE